MNEFFNLVGDYYNNLTNEESILLAIVGVLVFFLGVLVGWIVQGMKTRRYRKELLILRKERDEFEARYRAGERKLKDLAMELQTVSEEKVAALDRNQALQNDLAARTKELTGVRQQNEQLMVTNQTYASTIESLNDQVIGLKTQNEQLAADAANAANQANQQGAAAGANQEEKEQSNENLNAYIATAESRFQQLEDRIAWLANENTELRNASASTNDNPFTGHQPVVDPTQQYSGEPLIIRADTTEPGARTGDQGDTEVIVQTTPSIQVPPIGVSEDESVDDLTQIDNVGPFLQQKLNEAGVYRYEQIAEWEAADVTFYTDAIGYIPGIIQRDDWVGQAKLLAMSEAATSARPTTAEREPFVPLTPDAPSPAPAPARARPKKTAADGEDRQPVTSSRNEVIANKGKRENLKVVEGIGPKIQAILYDADISTLSDLADTPAERLREILSAAAPRLRGHDPKTWPVQAGLAADGKMDELKAWQQELKGGR